MLYPQNNKSRLVISLNGIWDFRLIDDNYIVNKKANDTIKMAVPASYNDLVVDRKIKDHVGKVLYQKNISLPDFKDQQIHLRIGSASHKIEVYIDSNLVGKHNGGFLPFDVDITSFAKQEFLLSIIVDNRLDSSTLPYGEINNNQQIYHHDFYNYSGIHRDVLIYTLPSKAIEDISIKTDVINNIGIVEYEVNCLDTVKVEVIDATNQIIANSIGNKGKIEIINPKLWDINQGKLYTLKVITNNDIYLQKFGIRSIKIKGCQLLLNDKPIYLKGFGKHEDFYLIGKANNSAVNIRDFNCLNWINANSFRTSHYPYCEEIYDLADELGILVINEVPAVGFNFWNGVEVFTPTKVNDATLATHKNQIAELINRDKNHPCVILLSVANEAATYELNSINYFKEIAKFSRQISPWPLMIVENVNPNDAKVSQDFDIIGINRYNAWYNNHGDLSVINEQLSKELLTWHQKFAKPLILSEFGADTIEGYHSLPSETFSEEFQVEYLTSMLEVIDKYDFIIGEHVWNFADFKTKQGLTRFRGNRKGIFTRDRQPKQAALYLKNRWSQK